MYCKSVSYRWESLNCKPVMFGIPCRHTMIVVWRFIFIWIFQKEKLPSLHHGLFTARAGASHYSCIWGMCGENMDYTDSSTRKCWSTQQKMPGLGLQETNGWQHIIHDGRMTRNSNFKIHKPAKTNL